jgi:hypothetical protein
MEDFLIHYHALDIAPGCTWEEIRHAYRQMTRQWHPDRHPPGPERAAAGERMKEINRAYDALTLYYQQYGTPPIPPNLNHGPTSCDDLTNDSAPTEDGATYHDISAGHVPTGTSRTASHHDVATQSPRRFARSTVALLITSLALIYLYPHEQATTTAPDTAVLNENDSLPATDMSNTHHLAQGYFTIGSTTHEVTAMQGPPGRITGTIWHYGESQVLFASDRVVTWHEHPDYPLAVKPLTRAATRGSMATKFGKGSTMAEVRAAQGEPLHALGNTWEYGGSRVQFEGGRVVSWYESPLAPLNLQK